MDARVATAFSCEPRGDNHGRSLRAVLGEAVRVGDADPVTALDRSRLVPMLGLGILLVVDLVLVVWALWPTALPANATGADAVTTAATAGSPSDSGSATATASPSASPSVSPPASPAALFEPKPLTRLVVALGGQSVWAADAGTCDTPGTVHVSKDGGRTWSSNPTPGSLTRLRPANGSDAFGVGGGKGCDLRLWRTSDGGEQWSGAQSAASAWGRSASDVRRVHRPEAAPVTPCPKQESVLDLVGLGRYNAAVLCSGGELRTTADGGRSWRTAAERPGAVALALSGTGQGVVAAVDTDCEGVVVQRLSGGRLAADRCVGGVTPAPGEVALSLARDQVWLVAGDAVLRASSPDAAFTRVSDWPQG